MISSYSMHEPIQDHVVAEARGKRLNKRGKLIAKTMLHEMLGERVVSVCRERNEFLDLKLLMDCLENTTEIFQQADFFY